MLILKYSIPNLAIVLITYFSKHYFFPVFLLLVGGPYSPSPKMRDFWEWKEFTDNYTETELKIGTDARQMGHKVMIFIAGNVDQEWYYSERSFLCAETLKSALRNCKVAGRIRSAYRFRHTECQAAGHLFLISFQYSVSIGVTHLQSIFKCHRHFNLSPSL